MMLAWSCHTLHSYWLQPHPGCLFDRTIHGLFSDFSKYTDVCLPFDIAFCNIYIMPENKIKARCSLMKDCLKYQGSTCWWSIWLVFLLFLYTFCSFLTLLFPSQVQLISSLDCGTAVFEVESDACICFLAFKGGVRAANAEDRCLLIVGGATTVFLETCVP